MYRIIGLQLLDYNQSCTYLNFGKADDLMTLLILCNVIYNNIAQYRKHGVVSVPLHGLPSDRSLSALLPKTPLTIFPNIGRCI